MTRLTLTTLRCPSSVAPETRTITGGEFSVGRGPGVDWVLPDPDQLVSRRHFTVLFRSGDWEVRDDSSNGTYPNRDEAPVGKGNHRKLRDHDRLRAGSYEIEVLFDAVEAPRDPYPALSGGYGDPAPRGLPDPMEDPDDPFNELLSSIDQAPPSSTPFDVYSRPDQSSALTDSMRPPDAIGHAPMHTGGLIPADDLLSDDWDKDLLDDIKPPVAPPVAQFPDPPADRPPPPVAAPGAPDSGLLAAFLEGVGLPDAKPAEPTATMQRLGEAFRALVAGVRAVLIARASVKSEFRIEQTMIRARGNNPLKFSAGDDDALSALLGVGRRTDMTPAAAVADALRDIRLHELASMAAMQSAVRSVLAGLHPDKVRAASEQGGGMSVLPGQRKARAWDAYEVLHARTVQALSDDFDSVFGKAFARAYEEALHDLNSKERP